MRRCVEAIFSGKKETPTRLTADSREPSGAVTVSPFNRSRIADGLLRGARAVVITRVITTHAYEGGRAK